MRYDNMLIDNGSHILVVARYQLGGRYAVALLAFSRKVKHGCGFVPAGRLYHICRQA